MATSPALITSPISRSSTPPAIYTPSNPDSLNERVDQASSPILKNPETISPSPSRDNLAARTSRVYPQAFCEAAVIGAVQGGHLKILQAAFSKGIVSEQTLVEAIQISQRYHRPEMTHEILSQGTFSEKTRQKAAEIAIEDGDLDIARKLIPSLEDFIATVLNYALTNDRPTIPQELLKNETLPEESRGLMVVLACRMHLSYNIDYSTQVKILKTIIETLLTSGAISDKNRDQALLALPDHRYLHETEQCDFVRVVLNSGSISEESLGKAVIIAVQSFHPDLLDLLLKGRSISETDNRTALLSINEWQRGFSDNFSRETRILQSLNTENISEEDRVQLIQRRWHFFPFLSKAGLSTESFQKLLVHTAKEHNLNAVRTLLSEGAILKEKRERAIEAAMDPEVLRILNSDNPILTASQGTDKNFLQQAVQEWLKRQDLSEADIGDAVKYAITNGHPEIVPIVLANETISIDDRTQAFTYAIDADDLDTAKTLIFDGDLIPRTLENTLIQSAEENRIGVLLMLLDNNKIQGKWNFPLALSTAAYKGHMNFVRTLLDRVEFQEWALAQAITDAASQGQEDIVGVLFSSADNACEHQNVSATPDTEKALSEKDLDAAITSAIKNDHGDVVRVLSARINLETRGSAIRTAIQSGHPQSVDILLESGPISEQDLKQIRILAASCPHLEIARSVLAYKQECISTPERGDLLRATSRGGHVDILQALLAYGDSSTTEIGQSIAVAIDCGHLLAALTLLKFDKTATLSEENRGTATQLAADAENLEAVTAFLENGPISKKDYGQTFSIASRKGTTSIVELLLNAGK